MTALAMTRASALHDVLEGLQGDWTDRNGMRVLARVNAGDEARRDVAGLADLSYRHRIGLKGPGAAAWVESLGLPLPHPNGWASLPGGGVVARLAGSEFLVEDGHADTAVARIRDACATPPTQIYPVWRHDAALALCGRRVHDLLAQVCSVNFRTAASTEVVMTMMAGVAVIVIWQDLGAQACCRIWCDPSFAPYLWSTLCAIAAELGGGPIGFDALGVG